MTPPRRILILMAEYGYGHRSAAKAVAAALEDMYGDQCVVAVVNPLDDPDAPVFLREHQSNYDKIVQEMPDLYKISYVAGDAPLPSALLEGARSALMFAAMRNTIERYPPDAIVCT